MHDCTVTRDRCNTPCGVERDVCASKREIIYLTTTAESRIACTALTGLSSLGLYVAFPRVAEWSISIMAKGLSVLVIAASPGEASQYVRELERGGYAPSVRHAHDEASLAEALDAPGGFDIVLDGGSSNEADAIRAVLRAKAGDVPVVHIVDSQTAPTPDEMRGTGTQRITRVQLDELASAVERAIEPPAIQQATGDDLDQLLLSSLMATMTDRIYVKDLEGRFIRVNRAVADLFGLDDPARARGKTDFDFSPPSTPSKRGPTNCRSLTPACPCRPRTRRKPGPTDVKRGSRHRKPPSATPRDRSSERSASRVTSPSSTLLEWSRISSKRNCSTPRRWRPSDAWRAGSHTISATS